MLNYLTLFNLRQNFVVAKEGDGPFWPNVDIVSNIGYLHIEGT